MWSILRPTIQLALTTSLSPTSCAAYSPWDEYFGNIIAESLRHIPATNIGDTLQRQADVHRVSSMQIILDSLYDEFHQLVVCTHQHRNEQVTLQSMPTVGVNAWT